MPGDRLPSKTQLIPEIEPHYCPVLLQNASEKISLPDVFTISHYSLALEGDPLYQDDIMVFAPGLNERHKYGFLYGEHGITRQGTGVALDGKYITIDWENSDFVNTLAFEYGVGGKGGKPIAWKTVATGDPRLPMGTKFVLDIYPGIIFIVNDTGEFIGENHIDIFVGALTISETYELGVKESLVTILSGGK
jgi:3D (Asp-Asp-Asp) domain-containing protein